MPSLQVRNLPDFIYEGLRACAKEDNRSLAQETTFILQEYLAARLRVTKDRGKPPRGELLFTEEVS